MWKVEFIKKYGVEAYNRKLKERNQWNNDHKEELKEKRELHKEEKSAYDKEYKQTHKEERKEYYLKNQERILKQQKEYLQTKKGKEAIRKRDHKRRGKGHIRLNERFEGCNEHHSNEEYVICIPEVMHKSVWHNLYTCQGMEEINNLAMNYLCNRLKG